jgi:DNA-directed RNA polymerase subunit RPC12/RpoP
MERPGNVVRLADHPRRRKPVQRAVTAQDAAANYFCLRCEADEFRLYAGGMIHCAKCGALMRNLLVNAKGSPPETAKQ